MSRRAMICYLEEGTVTEADVKGRVKVKFYERNLVSFWLPVNLPSVGADKYSRTLKPGDPVRCLMDANCERGVVIGGSYTDANPPARPASVAAIDFEDGGSVSYDKDTGELSINVVGDQKINIAGACQITVAGDAKIKAAAAVVESESIKLGGDDAVAGVVHEQCPCVLFGIMHPGSAVTKTLP